METESSNTCGEIGLQFSVQLLDHILSATRGEKRGMMGGKDLFRLGSADQVKELLRAGILQETAPLAEVPCSEQCDCTELWLQVRKISDSEAMLFCASGQSITSRVPFDEVRRFRFGQTEFLQWLCRSNGWQVVPGIPCELARDIVHFAEWQHSSFRMNLCFAADAAHVSFVDRIQRLTRSASPGQPLVVFVPHEPCLTLQNRAALISKHVVVSRLVDLLRDPGPAVDLRTVLQELTQPTRLDEPALILRRIASGKKRGFATELAGRAVGSESMPLGRVELLLLLALMHGEEKDYNGHLILETSEQALVEKLHLWKKRGWVTANFSHNELPHHRLAKIWGRFTQQLRRKQLDRLFQRVREGRNVYYRLLLSRGEVDCKITDLEQAIADTADSGRRPS